VLFAASVVFFVIKMAPSLFWGQSLYTKNLVAHLLGISLVFLVVGLLAPILSLVAYTEVALLGKVVFKYESKGVITTVLELVRSGNIFIAGVLFAFSVVTPLVKHIFAFMAILSSEHSVRIKYVRFLSVIGKWSMADVMVVAVLLSFFVIGEEGFSDSWLGAGLYFFTGYCVLSLITIQLITNLKEREI